jgi:hypothetical protein
MKYLVVFQFENILLMNCHAELVEAGIVLLLQPAFDIFRLAQDDKG